jgi:hypothetical protein
MARIDNWPRALTDFAEERRKLPFVWGQNDCCLFAANWVAKLTGVDPAASLRGKYTTAAGAARIIKRRGGMQAMVGKICAGHGWPMVNPKLARRGDVVLIEQATGPALAVCMGEHAAAAGPNGVSMVPTLSALAGWRID